MTGRPRVRMGRVGPAVVFALAVPWLAGGCALFGYPFVPGFDEELPSPSILARYATGSATMTLDDGTVVELTEVSASSSLDNLTGTNVHWIGPDGWHLRLTGAGGEGMLDGGYLQIDRIVGGEHWTVFDFGGCAVDVDRADERGVEGTATCRGLQWYDALDESWTVEPSPIDQPEWDAEITFEAAP